MTPSLRQIVKSLREFIEWMLELLLPGALKQVSDGPHRAKISELPGCYRAPSLSRIMSMKRQLKFSDEIDQGLKYSLGLLSIIARCGSVSIFGHLSLRRESFRILTTRQGWCGLAFRELP
jgi:hypothetical protein